jgi:hypothetical protein
MTAPMRRPFNGRAFWSLLAAVTLLGLPWTGIEVHLHQADPLTVDRHAWMAAHWVLATLFTVAATAHVVLNFRALSRYARALPARLVPASREALLAIVLTSTLLFLGVAHAHAAGEGVRGAATQASAEDGGRGWSDLRVRETIPASRLFPGVAGFHPSPIRATADDPSAIWVDARGKVLWERSLRSGTTGKVLWEWTSPIGRQARFPEKLQLLPSGAVLMEGHVGTSATRWIGELDATTGELRRDEVGGPR